MTIAWDSAQQAITRFIAACRVVDPGPDVDGVLDPYANIVWEREASAIAFGDLVLLRISGETSKGFDDVEMVDVNGQDYPRVTGYREFVLSIRYNSRSQVTAARKALETIRSSFHNPARAQILDDAGIAFLSTETLQTFDAVSDTRWESIAVLDVRMSALSEQFDPENDAPTGYLTEVGMSINGGSEETIPDGA